SYDIIPRKNKTYLNLCSNNPIKNMYKKHREPSRNNDSQYYILKKELNTIPQQLNVIQFVVEELKVFAPRCVENVSSLDLIPSPLSHEFLQRESRDAAHDNPEVAC